MQVYLTGLMRWPGKANQRHGFLTQSQAMYCMSSPCSVSLLCCFLSMSFVLGLLSGFSGMLATSHFAQCKLHAVDYSKLWLLFIYWVLNCSFFALISFFPELISADTFQEAVRAGAQDLNIGDWRLEWVLRYNVIVKSRGIIKSKGYLVSAKKTST